MMMSKNALRAFCLILFPTLASLLLSTACTQPMFQPPGGDYDSTQYVIISIPNATAIYYTLDGAEPSERCLQYTGMPIEVSATTVIKVVYYAQGVKSDVISETYNFPGGGGDNSYTNSAMLEAWVEYETATRQLIQDKYWDGCQPVTRSGPPPCSGQLTLGDLGTGYFVDDGAGGTVTWDVLQEGLGGKSIVYYDGYDFTLGGGGVLEATAGQVVGHLDMNGTGSTNTAEGETIELSGAFTGTIEDAVTITDGERTGGFFEVTCTNDPDCASGMQTYLVSEGPVFTLFDPQGEGSCTAPYYLIHSSYNGKCLGSVANGTGLNLQTCLGIETQKWNILPDTSTAAPDDYKIQSIDGQSCVTTAPQPLIGFLTVKTAPCEINLLTQSFRFEKDGNSIRIRVDDTAYPSFPNVCVSVIAVNVNDPVVYGWYCGPEAYEYWEILFEGAFPGIDPETDL
jgi:hypothetical protein